MNQFAISQYQPAFACGSFQPGVLLPAPRALSEEEVERVSGGLPIIVAPIIIKGAEIAAGAFIGGFFGAAGTVAFQWLFNDHTGSH